MIQFRVPQKSCFSGSFLLKIASHGQTVHFRLYSVIHHRKALVISFHMVFFKSFNVDPARRQIFGNASAEKCIPVLRVRLKEVKSAIIVVEGRHSKNYGGRQDPSL